MIALLSFPFILGQESSSDAVHSDAANSTVLPVEWLSTRVLSECGAQGGKEEIGGEKGSWRGAGNSSDHT